MEVSSENDLLSSEDSPVVAVVKDNVCQSTQKPMRFRVVKLVSSEPYLRGRWNCKDFLSKESDSSLSSSTVVSVANESSSVSVAPQPVTTQQTTSATTPQTTAEANGVAIDNKIEQAMDLVKSHLMFAVREEVDVLKERIKELESEIQILRAHASNDTLQLLLQQQQRENQPNGE